MNEQSHIQALSNRVYRRRDDSRLEPTVGESRSRLIAERYRLSARVGTGRLGEIYEGFDEASGELGVERRVAIQLLDARIVGQPGVFDDLRRAYAALRAGPHVNVVDILDFGRDGDVVYLVMDLIDGASLRFVLDEAVTLSPDETCAVARAVGDALQYLHAKGIVHGALAPESVFVTFDYAVKLGDIAPAGVFSTAPYYVEDGDAPEPTRDRRDDVYSLACLTYELLSGKHPFNSNSPREAQRAGMKPAPIAGLAPGQWRAIASGLALQRGLRTSTIGDFLYELGVQGTERLRPAQPVLPPKASLRESGAAVPTAPPSLSQHAIEDEELGASPLAVREHWRTSRFERGKRGKSSRTASTLLMLVVVAGLGALGYTYYAPLRDRALELLAARGAGDGDVSGVTATSTNLDPRAPARGVPATPTEQPSQVPPGDRAGVAGVPVETSISPLESTFSPAETERPAVAAAPEPRGDESADRPGEPIAGPQIDAADERPAAASAEPPTAATNEAVPQLEPSAAATTPPPVAGPPFSIPSTLAVSESEAAAVVVVRRGNAAAAASVVWWTSGDTAVAGEDYADFGERTEDFAAGEESRSLLIPLVSDARPERRESFYVYVGRYDSREGRLEPYSATRVDIADDD